MSRLHTLAGLPRSGSTLLANVFAQHPDVTVTGTSALCTAVGAVATVLATSEEVKSDLANVPGSPERYAEAMRGLIAGWHSDVETDIVIDKGRGWALHRVLLDEILPGTVTIMCVRDPRDVMASVERQHRASGVFPSPFGQTLYAQADTLLSPEGVIGGPLRLCEDLIRRKLGSVEWVRYETFVLDPLATMRHLEQRLGIDKHKWDFDNVENVATDLDALYLGKFPHEGSGAIKPSGTAWTDVLSDDLAELIAGVAPLYMSTFGYTEV